jgi:broad specificity phosphatase PhoE
MKDEVCTHPVLFDEEFEELPHEHSGLAVGHGDVVVALLRLLLAVVQHVVLVGVPSVTGRGTSECLG